VRQRARQNHLLLLRSVELMQRFLSTVFHATDPATYDQSGQVFAPAIPSRPLYEAIG
jgi:hypothetical protein